MRTTKSRRKAHGRSGGNWPTHGACSTSTATCGSGSATCTPGTTPSHRPIRPVRTCQPVSSASSAAAAGVFGRQAVARLAAASFHEGAVVPGRVSVGRIGPRTGKKLDHAAFACQQFAAAAERDQASEERRGHDGERDQKQNAQSALLRCAVLVGGFEADRGNLANSSRFG